jgi:hypothetical protein
VHRLPWLPAFALMLALLCAIFHRFEHRPPRRETGGPGDRAPAVRPAQPRSDHAPAG